jgi:uncharacterized protein
LHALRSPAYATWLWKRRFAVMAASVLVLGTAAWLSSRLQLRTNFAELLPSRDPAVAELERLGRSLDGTAILQIAIESPDRDANLRFAADLTTRLRALGPETVATCAYEVTAEKDFFHRHRWLYAPLADLTALTDSVREAIGRKNSPMFVSLDDDEPERVLERVKKKARKLERFPSGIFESDGGKLVAVVCRPPGGLFAERAGEALAAGARAAIVALDPARYHSELRTGLTGDVMAQLEERAALESDLAWASVVCIVLVCVVVVRFFRRLRAVFLVVMPALAGVVVSFAVAQLAFGYLNASTAFLGSIVIGNGINFAIMLLARYDEERRAGHAAEPALATAIATTWRPTLLAALGAAMAYGSLAVTRFRGFSQFGVIGATGMMAAWTAAFTLMPALIATFSSGPPRSGSGEMLISSAIGRMAARAPRVCLALVAVLTVASLVPLYKYLHDPFEYDFRKLRNQRSFQKGGAAELATRVDAIFGLTLTPSVVLSDTRAHTGEIRALLLARDRGKLLGDVTTVEDFLPGDAATQARKLEVLGELRRLIDGPLMKHSDDADQKRFAEMRPPDDLRVISDADLPAAVKRPFTERDGTLGRIVLVYHDAHVSVWDGHNLLGLSDLMAELPLEDGTVVRSSGHAVVFAAMIRSITRDAPLASAVALGAVVLMVLLTIGVRGAPLVLGPLLCGAAWTLGGAALLDVRANFLNFIALPITFGIGVDYSVNIYLRWRDEGDPARAVEATGGAVALCSLTTVIGYGALLVADNQALRSFGSVAIVGELACLAAGLVALPAWLAMAYKRK